MELNYTLKIADVSDIEGVLVLQSLNHISTISPENLSNGFVTTPFTVSQIQEIISQDGLFVALNDVQNVVAYVFAGSWQYFSQWPIFEDMIKRLPLLEFDGIQATIHNSFQYGPICIHHDYRGSQLLIDLFEFMRISMESKYTLGLSFINKLNLRSHKAHTQKLNWTVIDDFTFNNHEFYFIAYNMNLSVKLK